MASTDQLEEWYSERRKPPNMYVELALSRYCVLTTSLGTAGAGSLILEFGTLSRLTGDDRFEKAAYKAYFALWNRKSEIGLVGNTINVRTGVCSCDKI